MAAIIKSTRIESIDVLRGIVMVVMALDHTRDYFHFGSFFSNPTNLETTTPFLFFTRFITHYCAPIFVFLAGTAAFLYGTNKTKPSLFKFLFTRGLWLIFLEFTLNNFLWWFDITFSFVVLQVIWVIGLSMVVLSFLIFLRKKILLAIGAILVLGHNLLDTIKVTGNNIEDIIWYILHQGGQIYTSPDQTIGAYYPAIPWIGIMVLGYCFGYFFKKDFDVALRKKWLLYLGFGAIGLFFLIRGLNVYGDPVPWTPQNTTAKTIMSFFKVSKYPPSLAYTLITLGPAMLFLYGIESIKNKVTNFLLVFGRVPLFYYFVHILVIHVFAIIGIVLFGGNWQDMIITKDAFSTGKLLNYGYSLCIVYLVWIMVIAFLYPFCKKYMAYKANNKDKWWLSYL
ncbi:DUF1624 domain-containing protein [Postechiella marina]|uniref:DUF1624 domain-containing protein n=1 Tax=Postechiella marina TaxID=943941 RepID=A0ABP8CCY3_9FLAO